MSIMRDELLIEVERMIKHSGLTKYKIAKGAGISAIILSRWEKGERNPSLTTLEKLHKFLYAYMYPPGNLSNSEISKMITDEMVIKFAKSNFKLIPLVQSRNRDEYISNYKDNLFLSELPVIPMGIDESFKGKYMCFEVDGDSMNDGTNKSLLDGDIVLGRKIKRDAWKYNIQVSDFFFIVITAKDISICKIVENNINGREFICEPLNPIYGEKYSVRMTDVKELYHVAKLVDRQIRI